MQSFNKIDCINKFTYLYLSVLTTVRYELNNSELVNIYYLLFIIYYLLFIIYYLLLPIKSINSSIGRGLENKYPCP